MKTEISKPLKCAILKLRQLLRKNGISYELWKRKEKEKTAMHTHEKPVVHCHCGRPHDNRQDYRYHRFNVLPFNDTFVN